MNGDTTRGELNLRRRLVWSSLKYHKRMSAAVAAGVAAATAVIVGALLVGESMRGSLRDMTLDRLGHFDELLVADRFFRQQITEELSNTDGFDDHFALAMPAIYFVAGSAEVPNADGFTSRRSANIQILGVPAAFWEQARSTATNPETTELTDRQVILNQPLADELQVEVGDRITLRLPAGDDIPAESTLAQKDGRVTGLTELEVAAVAPAEGLGRFSLQANQALPKVAYVNLTALQRRLDEPGKCNAVFVAGKQMEPTDAGHEWLAKNLRWRSEDLGLHIRRHRLDADGEPVDDTEPLIFDYYSVTSDRMVLEDEVATAVLDATKQWQSVAAITYLADTIATDSREDGIPYSMVTGIDNSPLFSYLPADEPLGDEPLGDEQLGDEQLGDDEIALNQITAQRLSREVGDRVTLYYLEPESSHGEAEMQSVELTVRAILPLTQPSESFDDFGRRTFDTPPTRFNDPALTPEVEGITDADSINSWEAPFPGYDKRRILEPDELYWDDHRTTPRAIVSLATGQRLWGSRFGKVTSVMVPASEADAEAIAAAIRGAIDRQQVGEAIGLAFQPVKAEGLAASSGTTPFDGLFLGLSFFIIFAAVVLVSILFRLGIEQRYSDVGLLSALGLQRPDVMKLFVREGLWVAGIGSLFGVPLGLLYGAAMIAGLRTLWVGAIGTQFLRTHVTWISPVIGLLCGVLVSATVIYVSIRFLKNRSIRSLLAGQTDATAATGKSERWNRWLVPAAVVAIVAAAGLGFAGTQLSGEPQALSFVGSGAMLLAALTTLAWNWLRKPGGNTLTLSGLAISNAKRNATRSGMTIGLVATACFLILAMSALRLAPNQQGSGGFRWLARSSAPLYGDLHLPATRMETLGVADLPGDAEVYSLRVKPGDDASCRNLYQSTQPQVYGVTEAFIRRYDEDDVSFGWAKHAELTAEEGNNPWNLLNRSVDEQSGAIPVFVDNNTAMYSLHWYGGVGAEYDIQYERGQTVRVRVVGLLANSVLQGALMMSEQHFKQTFPQVSGFRLFLIDDSTDAPSGDTPNALVSFLEEGLSDQGFDVQSTEAILDDLLAVQNTYLSAFQSLGALGLIFGVFGLAAVQLRNVFERRKELALMRAQGFAKQRLGRLVFVEMLLLLLGGLAVGVVSALAAVLPHMLSAGVKPPVATLSMWLLVILVTGMMAGMFAVRRTIAAPVVTALRGE